MTSDAAAPSTPLIFISYQRTDGDFARRVREHLVAAGVRTWMDQFDIPVGAYWTDEIDKGLAASDIVVGVLSPESVESRNVKNEWDWAIAHERRLLLLQVKPCVISHCYVWINFIDAALDVNAALGMLPQTLGITDIASERESQSFDRVTDEWRVFAVEA